MLPCERRFSDLLYTRNVLRTAELLDKYAVAVLMNVPTLSSQRKGKEIVTIHICN